MKKFLGIVVVATIAVATAWNFNQSKNDVEAMDLTLDNLEAIAQGRGNFPACQKNEGSREYGTIPFCVSGSCKNTWAKKGTLDVNYCSQ